MKDCRVRWRWKYFKMLGVLLVLVSLVLCVVFLLRGEVEFSGGYLASEVNRLVVCSSSEVHYPFFIYDYADSQLTVIKMTTVDDNLKTISLIQKMFYTDFSYVVASEAINHAAMNKAFGDVLGADALGANYYLYNNALRLSIYADFEDYNMVTKKFFLVETDSTKISEIEIELMDKGFSCVDKKEDN